jgi:uncharacterized repeat protein (TIGR03803 family)
LKSLRAIARILRLLLVAAAATTAATAQTYTVLYNFGVDSGDPNDPVYSGIIAEGLDGTMYSTTDQTWSGGLGDVFSITPTGTLTVLHTFNGADGQNAQSGLTLASDGNFYGTTQLGGASGNGTIFRITAGGTLNTLYNFTGGNDGGSPIAPPIQGNDGNFYGTTTSGGSANDGSVYVITAAGTFTTLHSFDGTDGQIPMAPLMQAMDGNFYGTTFSGGSNGSGTIFKVSSSGAFNVLFNFGQVPGYPVGPLIQGSDGNFYGTTEGASSNSSGGVVFQITPSGALTVLHTFTGGSDGSNPVGGLVLATDGNFYGTNDLGGANGWGVLFRVSSTGIFATLHDFDSGMGASPQVTLLQHTNGLLYGDTAVGGSANEGVFYSFGLAPPMAMLSPNALTFAAQGVDTTSAAQIVTLTNSGGKPLNLTQIAASGDFAESNTCNPSLVAESSCQISVTFTPTATGSRTGAVTITDNAQGSPQSVSLVGVGVAPAASFSPTSLTFPSQYVGTAGLNQNVQLTNNGNATLIITSVVASPTSDFSQLSACGNSVDAGASCSIGVFFDPSTSGTRGGTLTITDNAPTSPQVVALTGTGQDFSMSSPSTNQSISPGQTASYSVTVAPAGGFNETVALSCSGAPPQSTCALSSNSVTLMGSTPATVTVTVTTTGGSASLTQPFGGGSLHGGAFAWLAFFGTSALAMMPIFSKCICGHRQRMPCGLAFFCLLSLGVTMSACGGGNSGNNGGRGGTQAGTYSLTVTGAFTSGATTLTHATRLTLVVQ